MQRAFWHTIPGIIASAARGVFTLLLIFIFNIAAITQGDGTQNYVDSLYYSAKDLYYDGDYEEALDLFHFALSESRSGISKERCYKLYHRIAKTYGRLRYQEQALAYLDTALVHCKALYGEIHAEVGDLYSDQGMILSQMLRIQASGAANKKAISIFTELYGPQSEQVGRMYMHMGINYYKSDEFAGAEVCYQRAMRIFKEALGPDHENHNRIYNSLGMLYRKKKDYQKALDYAEMALQFKLKNYLPDHPSVAKYYSNLARVYIDMDEYEKAIPFIEKTIAITESRYGSDHPEYGGSLSELAQIYFYSGKFQEAHDLFQKSNDIVRNRLGPTHPYAVSGFSNQAMCLQELGEYEQAIKLVKYANKLLQQAEEVYFPHVFDNCLQLVDLYQDNGQLERAHQLSDSLIQVLRDRSSQPNAIGFTEEYPLLKLHVLRERADIYKSTDGGQGGPILKNAWLDLSQAISIADDLQKKATSEASREVIFSQNSYLIDRALGCALDLYETTVDQAYLLSALELSEKSKANNLRLALQERDAGAYGLPAELRQQIERNENALYDLQYEIQRADDALLTDSLENWTRQIFRLRETQDEIIKTIEAEHPNYYALKYADPRLDIEDLQQAIKGQKKAILSYYLGNKAGRVFYISENQLQYFNFTWKKTYDHWIQELKTQKVSGATQFNPALSAEIYAEIWSKLAPWLMEDKIERISVSPHAQLSYLPFDLLGYHQENGDWHWLLQDYAISYTQSLYLISEKEKTSFDIAYAGFAPMYETQEESQMYALRDKIVPLPGTLQEVKSAAALFSGKYFVKEDASIQEFNRLADKTRILHLATHAFLKPGAPLDNALMFYDHAEGAATEDGRRTMLDIYNMHIPAELVVLSACQTGDGDLSAGDGPLSLARAFQYAGSQSVVMNQWRASDAASSAIVQRFLKNIAEGEPKDIALQQAKLSFLSTADPLAAHPFFWAGLSMYGNTETMDLPSVINPWVLTLLLLLLLAAFLQIGRRKRMSR